MIPRQNQRNSRITCIENIVMLSMIDEEFVYSECPYKEFPKTNIEMESGVSTMHMESPHYEYDIH